jgi:hypothetical protein
VIEKLQAHRVAFFDLDLSFRFFVVNVKNWKKEKA